MGTSNGGVMTDFPSSAGGRSQHQGRTSRRPPRACTARTPSRLAPAAPSVERTPSRKSHGPSRAESDPPFTPMVLNSPPPPDQEDRWHLRSMWELASINNFLNVFRPVLNIKAEYSLEELESALLTPNALLDAIHISLLKAIPPISRNPLTRETWVTALCKKMKDRWFWIAEGSFPLVPYHGEENNTYRELDPGTRVIILRALCEARLDQDDVRTFIDDKLKQGTSLSYIRKERTGIDMQGTTYWYENDPIAGQRLYRELRNSDNKEKTKLRGRGMPPPNPCQWETLATDLDEFLSVADKLSLSKNRMEVAIGKRINNDIVPEITELQKRRERALKKQQRQAQLLDSFLNTESMTAGRSRRDRKPVTYTFDDYDKSISEAIKITKRRQNSPEIPAARERKISNGVSRQHTDELESNSMDDEDQLETSSGMKRADGTSPSKQYESGIQSSESELSGDRLFGRGRRLRKPQKYRESEFIDPTFGDEAGLSSAEDIEGEALYDEGYRLKKRRVDDSSDGDDGDDEYRGDEDDEEDFDDEDEEEDDDYFGSSDEGESNWKRRSSKSTGRGRTRVTSKADRFSNSGLRRSQRATRSHIDYSKYEESDQSEEDRNDPISPDRVDSDTGAALANCRENGAIESMYVSNGQHMDKAGATEGTDDVSKAIECDLPENAVKDICVRENMNMIDAPHSSANEAKSEPLLDVKPDVKMHTFLDLNVAAPMIGGLDETCDGPYGHPSLFPVEKIQISGDDGSIYDPPKMVTEGLKR